MAAMDQIAIGLHRALESGSLPLEGRTIGQRLMTQLNSPTRVAVVGLAGSGKTSLVNMLLGASLMPDLKGVAAVGLAYGAVAHVEVVLADGTVKSGEGLADPSRIPPGAIRVTQELPDPRLKDWSFVEITPAHSGQGQLLEWMAKGSDIAIWCSQQFDDRERALWAHVPEHLKDHSFLALTRADRLFMKGELADRIARLQPVVADEFLGLYPIATLQAASARNAAENSDPLWQSSGGKALFEGIRQQVDHARMADLDHACLLLERYKVALPDQNRDGTDLPPTTLTVRPAAPPPPPEKEPLARTETADEVIDRALAVLQACADDLLAAPQTASAASADRIMERCNAAAENLVRLLSASDSTTPEIVALRDDVIEGEQMLMLLRLERGESAAEDSLTILLQLKKEISARDLTSTCLDTSGQTYPGTAK